jgi:hypothetical protein
MVIKYDKDNNRFVIRTEPQDQFLGKENTKGEIILENSDELNVINSNGNFFKEAFLHIVVKEDGLRINVIDIDI